MAGNPTITALPAPRTKQAPRSFNGLALDVRSCANLLGTTERAVRGMVSKRIIPHRRISSRLVFLRSEVEKWLENLSGCSLDEAEQNLALRRGDR